jgi:hypothetical protein
VYAANAAQSSPQATMVAPAAAAQAPAKHDAETADDKGGKHDAETADDNEPKGGPDTDNVQDGPGNTAEGPEANEKPGQETPDKNEAQERNAR